MLKPIAPVLAILLTACSGDGGRPDGGLTDTSSREAGGVVVKSVLLLGVTTDKDFKTNGKVTLTALPTAADGTAMIDKNLAFTVAAQSPAGLTSTVDGAEEKRPVASQPLITGLLFDSSGSMASTDPLRLRVAAGKQFIDQLAADDQVAVGDFGAGNTIGFKSTRLLQDFTTDKDKAKLAMALVKADGGTPMFESVSEVLVAFNLKFPAASYPNRALVVLGDGEPTGTGTLLGSCTVAKTTTVPVSTVGFGPAAYQNPQADLVAIWNLGALAGCSGGTYSSVPEAQNLSKAYGDIGQILKKGSVVITVTYNPIPTKTVVSGTLGVGSGSQTPVEVKYAFYAP